MNACIGRESQCTSKECGGLGFRMIHEFNYVTLIAKQALRLLSVEDSLVTKLYLMDMKNCSN